MYVPDHFAESRPEEMHRLIREHPLGALVTYSESGLDANHVPFMLDPNRGPRGTLIAHVARANAVWTAGAEGSPVLVIFRGAQGYISPNWYVSKHETHRHVPTWNYEVVHVHGRLRVHDEPTVVGGVVARLTRQQEAAQPHPWKMSDAPTEYLTEQIRRIIGIEVEITRIEGKRKLSQNREYRDFESTVDALDDRGHSELAEAMKRARTNESKA